MFQGRERLREKVPGDQGLYGWMIRTLQTEKGEEGDDYIQEDRKARTKAQGKELWVQTGHLKGPRRVRGGRTRACTQRPRGGAVRGDQAGVRSGLILENLPRSVWVGGATSEGCKEAKGHPASGGLSREGLLGSPLSSHFPLEG